MWPLSGATSSNGPLLGGLDSTPRSGRRVGLRKAALVAFSITSALSVLYTLNTYTSLNVPGWGHGESQPETPHVLPSEPSEPVEAAEQSPLIPYKVETCSRLDSQFEFGSPLDLTRLDLEKWTDCRPVEALEGWKVEHCTAPGSTWSELSITSEADIHAAQASFLALRAPNAQDQTFAYSPSSPPRHKSTEQLLKPTKGKASHCNPSGYFRVQRMSALSTTYTFGSDHANAEMRCRNDVSHPATLNETTRAYADNFLGPDYIRVELAGPELHITQQQFNLGECTYAIPYVLSRPGRFWLRKIEHVLQDFEGYNENYSGGARANPTVIHSDIVPTPPEQAPKEPQWGEVGDAVKSWNDFQEQASRVYSFMVCGECPQLLNPKSFPIHEDLPICSTKPIDGARQYGVHAGKSIITKLEDLYRQGYDWVPARPSCRLNPQWSALQTTEAHQIRLETEADPFGDRPYGSPPRLASSGSFLLEHNEAMKCLGRNRTVYIAGDSHARELLIAFVNRLRGNRNHDGEVTTKNWNSHFEWAGSVYTRQDFDQWLWFLEQKVKKSLGKTPDEHPDNDPDLLKNFDSLVLNTGAWPATGLTIDAPWTTERFEAFMTQMLWDLAAIRDQRRKHFKETGEGYDDLRIVWMGQAPWPETRLSADWRSNQHHKYWDILVDRIINEINEHYKDQGGMIDNLFAFSKVMPYRRLSADQCHHKNNETDDPLAQALIHKLDLCRDAFTPKFPQAAPEAVTEATVEATPDAAPAAA